MVAIPDEEPTSVLCDLQVAGRDRRDEEEALHRRWLVLPAGGDRYLDDLRVVPKTQIGVQGTNGKPTLIVILPDEQLGLGFIARNADREEVRLAHVRLLDALSRSLQVHHLLKA